MKHTKQSAGQLGGLATLARHGPEHFKAIGKRGASVFWKLYTMRPVETSQFAITNRETNKVIAFTSGRFGK